MKSQHKVIVLSIFVSITFLFLTAVPAAYAGSLLDLAGGGGPPPSGTVSKTLWWDQDPYDGQYHCNSVGVIIVDSGSCSVCGDPAECSRCCAEFFPTMPIGREVCALACKGALSSSGSGGAEEDGSLELE